MGELDSSSPLVATELGPSGHEDGQLDLKRKLFSVFRVFRLDVTLVFPEGSTGPAPPLDIYCLRQWKDFAKRLTEQCAYYDLRVNRRAVASFSACNLQYLHQTSLI